MTKYNAWMIGALVMVLLVPSALAFDYFLERLNYPPGESRLHHHTFEYNGNLTLVIPSVFTVNGSTGGPTITGNVINWSGVANATLELGSDNNCTEGEFEETQIYLNGTLIDTFRYICLPDNKIVDYKLEYGHGDANYLSDLYLSNETATLFNLIRVWNLGGYLEPNEDARNVSIDCVFEQYPLRTFGRANITHGNNSINSTFSWDELAGGYWFRIAVLSQDVGGQNIGDTYNVSCGSLIYDFDHARVNATFGEYSSEIRSIAPFNITFKNITGTDYAEITIHNIEEYPAFDIFFDRTLDTFQQTQRLLQLDPDERVTYKVDRGTAYNLTVHFIPPWYRNSRNPLYYEQIAIFNATGNVNVSNQSVSQFNYTVLVVPWNPLISGRPTGVNITVLFTNNLSGVFNATIDVTEVNGYAPFALPQRITSNVTSIVKARTYTDRDGFVALTIIPTGGSGLIGSEHFVGNYSIYVDATVDGVLVNRTYLNNTKRVLEDAFAVAEANLPSRSDIVTFHNFIAVIYDKVNDWLT